MFKKSVEITAWHTIFVSPIMRFECKSGTAFFFYFKTQNLSTNFSSERSENARIMRETFPCPLPISWRQCTYFYFTSQHSIPWKYFLFFFFLYKNRLNFSFLLFMISNFELSDFSIFTSFFLCRETFFFLITDFSFTPKNYKGDFSFFFVRKKRDKLNSSFRVSF